MAVAIPFPLPARGFALNSKVRVNLDYIVGKFNEFNTGTATWDAVYVGTANSATGPVVFYNAATAFYAAIQAGATSANTTYTLPTAAPAVSGSLHSSSTGVMTWEQSLKSSDSPTFSTITLSSLAVSSPPFATFSGTTNQVVITPSAGPTYTFSLPQSIGTGSNVTFNQVTADGGGIFGGVRTGPGSLISMAIAPNTDGGTGIYWGTHTMKFAAGGYDGPYVQLEPISLTEVQLRIPFGVTAIPGIASAANQYTGIAMYGTYIGLIINQLPKLEVTDTECKFTGDVNFTYGTISAGAIEPTSLVLKAGGFKTTLTSGATADFSLKLPVDAGTANYILKTDGAGNLGWVSVSAAGGATAALDNLASVAINASLLVDTDAAYDLGSSTKLFANTYTHNLYFKPNWGFKAGASQVDMFVNNVQHIMMYAGNTAFTGTKGTVIDHADGIIRGFNDNEVDLGTGLRTFKDLHLKGTAYLTGVARFADGTVTSPSITFGSDTDTGIYRIGANNLGITCNEAKVVDIGTTGIGITGSIFASDGSVGAPSISFNNNTNTGIYRIGTNQIGIATNGIKRVTIAGGGLSVFDAQFLGPDNTIAGIGASAPSYSFTGDTNTGMYQSAADTLAFSAGGTKVIEAASTGVAIKGTTTNDNAAAGFVGEFVESTGTNVNAFGSGTWGDGTSISLTAGDWDVSAHYTLEGNGATWSLVQVGISTTSGNSSTGLTNGKNYAAASWASSSTAITNSALAIPSHRVSLSATTTVYCKFNCTYSAGTPRASGLGIRARRVR